MDSSSKDEKVPELTIALLRKTQGRKGELAAEILTDFPKRFERTGRVRLVRPDGSGDDHSIEGVWFHKNSVVFKFSSVDTLEKAKTLVGCEVRVPRSEAVALPSHHHFVFDLVGCRVVEEGRGRDLGRVKEFLDFGSNRLLAVETGQGELLIPFAESFCCSIDTERGEIRVRLPEGLRDLNS